MRVLLKNTITKKVMIVLITIVMISNFVMPNYVCAKSAGEKLVSGIFYLIAYVGDVGIKLMQKMMIGTNEIKDGDEYDIKYSPGLIFSNSIIALDVNFIKPNEGYLVREGGETSREQETLYDETFRDDYDTAAAEAKADAKIEELLKENGYYDSTSTDQKETDTKYQTVNPQHVYSWNKSDGDHYNVGKITLFDDDADVDSQQRKFIVYMIRSWEVSEPGGTITSPAKEMQASISKWYIALRTIALVGLLSVLLYIGIRIILSSSSANDKAKYKNMLKDWIVAICILFTLHYMMAFMLEMTASLNHIINNNVVESSSSETPEGSTGEYKTDKLMNAVREGVGDSYEDASALNTASYTIMYLALVILTGVFTVQYLKRVIYMAFLTMIAPMIALTYPLDKIKDSKAQAFSFWLREYIFNCLIQPVHFLLYTLLISNVGDFATNNIIYSVVALGFLVPAEKLIKEMFGMKSATPVGTLGAAAGGAVVMSMLNKMKAKPPKGEDKDGSGSSAPKGVRTATRSSSGNSGTNGGNGTETGTVAENENTAGGTTGIAPAMAANAVSNNATPASGNKRNNRWSWSWPKCIKKKIHRWGR
jgi:hypothetical protein